MCARARRWLLLEIDFEKNVKTINKVARDLRARKKIFEREGHERVFSQRVFFADARQTRRTVLKFIANKQAELANVLATLRGRSTANM